MYKERRHIKANGCKCRVPGAPHPAFGMWERAGGSPPRSSSDLSSQQAGLRAEEFLTRLHRQA
jgi:hypothetical protein